jgi:glyoxylase-like metal-dependent hydrolase (beta-lactamase superfamily II)
MGLEIKILDLGDISLEASFLVLGHGCGTVATVPTFGYLILGGEEPVLVDTGFRDPEIMAKLGMTGTVTGEQGLDRQLAKHGLRKSDVRWIVHTHLHIDHAGLDHEFPLDTTTVVVNRRELEYSVSGIMGEQYPADYISTWSTGCTPRDHCGCSISSCRDRTRSSPAWCAIGPAATPRAR